MITLPQNTLVIASHNQGKISDITALFAPFDLKILSATDLGLPEPEETETTFIGNAKLKAEAAMQASGLAALADDSGLSIPALGGQPGIHSARWAGPTHDFAIAIQRIAQELQPHHDRRGFFTCALALALPDGQIHTFEGHIWGTIVFPPRGDRAFGYSPIFQPDGYEQTFGEMSPEDRNRISHRRLAFDQLIATCFS
ncbi:MAG: RdgB/HAM1 family non-canonical purine NTP pyrophosphatase [Alphaproteobacteria bacterium]